MIARFGSMVNLVTQVLEPTIGNYFRNAAQGTDVIDFLRTRRERQDDARKQISSALTQASVVAAERQVQIQEFQASAAVKTAEGQAASRKLVADGEAYATRATGNADAEKTKAVGTAEADVIKLKIDSTFPPSSAAFRPLRPRSPI